MKTLHEYFVYITTNPNRKALYIGVTNDVAARLVEHYANRGKPDSFAGKYYFYCLIYLESYQYVEDVIAREKSHPPDRTTFWGYGLVVREDLPIFDRRK